MNTKVIIAALIAMSLLVPAYIYERRASDVSNIVSICSKEEDRSGCYERVVPALYPQKSVPELFDIIRKIRRADPQYQFCHVLAHKIGEQVVAADPSHWLDAIPLNPTDGMCSNGYIHGVVGGRFRSEVLDEATIKKFSPDFARACEPRANWHPSDLDRAICYHGMGHLYDFITDANISRALELCKETVPEDTQRVCVEGVFMQIYQPLEPDDFLLIERMKDKPSTTTVRTYCSQYRSDPSYEGACLRESWPYYRDELMKGNVSRYCADQPNGEQADNCYQSASTLIGRQTLGDIDAATAACARFPADRMQECYNDVAQAALEEDRNDISGALDRCGRAPEAVEKKCMENLTDHARFIFGSDTLARDRFCTALPDDLRSQCLKN